MLTLASIGMLTPVASVKAEDANAACAHFHGDPAPGYTGPLPVGLICGHQPAPLATWTVPPLASVTRFGVVGAEDVSGNTRGGRVDATLNLVPGSILTLEMGGDGEASVVRLGNEVLLAAGGGDGIAPNFVTPAATAVESLDPGAPLDYPWPRTGEIWVEWTYFYESPPGEEEESLPEEGEEPLPEEEALPEEKPLSEVISPLFEVIPPPLNQMPPCTVPRLKGLKPIAARKALVHANCTLGTVGRAPARPHRRGRIIRQSPTAGSSQAPGTPVAITVGRRP